MHTAAATTQNIGVARARVGPDLTIVVPTFNERDNIRELVAKIDKALAGEHWELVFVADDSTDGTVNELRALVRADARVRFLHRIGRRGLASAVVEGTQSSAAPFVAVMDADLQHDERILPAMLATLRGDTVDVVIGSRYIEGGGVGPWSEERVSISKVASMASRLVLRTPPTDPMSGFFMLRREAFDGVVRKLSSQGFKILLDVLASARGGLRVAEVPYTFRNRMHGESKLDSAVAWEYLTLLLDKMVGRYVPARFVMFIAVGGVGVVVHMGVLWSGTALLAQLPDEPGRRHRDGDDVQLLRQRRADLPRPPAQGLEGAERPADLLSDLFGRGGGQRRHRQFHVRRALRLVALGAGRHPGRGSLERGQLDLHLAQGLTRATGRWREAASSTAAGYVAARRATRASICARGYEWSERTATQVKSAPVPSGPCTNEPPAAIAQSASTGWSRGWPITWTTRSTCTAWPTSPACRRITFTGFITPCRGRPRPTPSGGCACTGPRWT
jgi:hypothetical protein